MGPTAKVLRESLAAQEVERRERLLREIAQFNRDLKAKAKKP